MIVHVNNNIFNIYKKFFGSLSSTQMCYSTKQTTSKVLWLPCTLHIFWRRLWRCLIIEFALSEEYVIQLSLSNVNAYLTSSYIIHLLCCWGTVNIWHVKQWWHNQHWTLLLPPSVAYPYQQVNNSSSFRLLVICFATAPLSICVVFLQPHQHLFFILESGNIFLNSLAAWYALLKGRFCAKIS